MAQLFNNLSREDYDEIAGENFSRLKLILRSPREYQLNQVKETDAMRLGTALHMAYLEPMKFKSSYVVEPTMVKCLPRDEKGKIIKDAEPIMQPLNRRMADHKAYIESWRKDHSNSVILTGEEMEAITGMIGSINEELRFPPPRELNLLTVGELLATREAEVTSVGEWNGRPIKARADLLVNTRLGKTVVDIKKSGRPWDFNRKIYDMNYDMQAAFYMKAFDADAFVWLVLGDSSPFPVLTYNAEHFIDIGKKKVDKAFTILEQCEKENYWPWGTRGVESPFPSDWIMKQYFEQSEGEI
jgi:hypothetical protein